MPSLHVHVGVAQGMWQSSKVLNAMEARPKKIRIVKLIEWMQQGYWLHTFSTRQQK